MDEERDDLRRRGVPVGAVVLAALSGVFTLVGVAGLLVTNYSVMWTNGLVPQDGRYFILLFVAPAYPLVVLAARALLAAGVLATGDRPPSRIRKARRLLVWLPAWVVLSYVAYGVVWVVAIRVMGGVSFYEHGGVAESVTIALAQLFRPHNFNGGGLALVAWILLGRREGSLGPWASWLAGAAAAVMLIAAVPLGVRNATGL